MAITAVEIFKSVEDIRAERPLIHNITNYVVMNNTANALLAIGASPVMIHAEEEVEDMAAVAGALAPGSGDRGGELAAVLQQLKGPHYQPVTAPIQRSPAGQWPAGRCEI